jgi:hypothetical protein
MNSGLLGKLALGMLMLSLALAAAGIVEAGVVSNYRVNGETVTEGSTFDELRAIAGDPLEIVEPDSNPLQVEWVYQCSTAGAGPCKVVATDGKREMRARFQLGRLKIIRFQRN